MTLIYLLCWVPESLMRTAHYCHHPFLGPDESRVSLISSPGLPLTSPGPAATHSSSETREWEWPAGGWWLWWPCSVSRAPLIFTRTPRLPPWTDVGQGRDVAELGMSGCRPVCDACDARPAPARHRGEHWQAGRVWSPCPARSSFRSLDSGWWDKE